MANRRAQWALRNVRGAVSRALAGSGAIRSLERYEQRFSSQNGEDGILAALYARIGTTNRYFVEFGVEDGRECCSRYLRERHGWTGLLMDGGDHARPFGPLRREFITAENVNALFAKYGVPSAFDLLVIDIDGNDYWVWKAVSGYSPRVVVVEYNAALAPPASVTVPYDPAFRWDGGDYHGASLVALERLGRRKGYTLVGCDGRGVNAFFVRADLCAGQFAARPVGELYRPPRFGARVDGRRTGHPHRLGRPWVDVDP
jgi:hypothetical protein